MAGHLIAINQTALPLLIADVLNRGQVQPTFDPDRHQSPTDPDVPAWRSPIPPSSDDRAWGPYPSRPPYRDDRPYMVDGRATSALYWPPDPVTAPARPKTKSPKVLLVAVALITAMVVGALSFTITRSLSDGNQLAGTTFSQRPTQTLVPASPARPIPSTPTPSNPTPSNPARSTPSTPSTPGRSSTVPSDWSAVTAAVNPGVVDIESRLPQGVGAGTGMVLSATGEILTNNHVVEGASQIVVTVVSTGNSYRADVVGTDPANDVAVLQLAQASSLATIPLGNSDEVKVGDPVAAIGNAGGQGAPILVAGAVLGLHQQITAADPNGANATVLTDMIQVDANVVEGDSGGPLANRDGKVIGMNSAATARQSRSRAGTTEGFAIPINRALNIAKQIQANPNGSGGSGRSGQPSPASRGVLGVQVQAVGASGATNAGAGAAVVAVQAGSPAQKAGLRAGDIILGVDDVMVTSPTDLTGALTPHRPGDQIALTFQHRTGGPIQASITLA